MSLVDLLSRLKPQGSSCIVTLQMELEATEQFLDGAISRFSVMFSTELTDRVWVETVTRLEILCHFIDFHAKNCPCYVAANGQTVLWALIVISCSTDLKIGSGYFYSAFSWCKKDTSWLNLLFAPLSWAQGKGVGDGAELLPLMAYKGRFRLEGAFPCASLWRTPLVLSLGMVKAGHPPPAVVWERDTK